VTAGGRASGGVRKERERGERRRRTDDGAALGLVCRAFLAGVFDDEVEEDVEPAEVARHFAVPLQVNEQELVHVLAAGERGGGVSVRAPG
jgi:hypothetical protein